MFGAVTPIDKIATKVANTTVTKSPNVKGSPVLSFFFSSPINFLEYIKATKNVKYMKNIKPPKHIPNLKAFIKL